MTSQSHIDECPLASVRTALKLTRHEFAALAGVNYNLVANTELGYFAEIPDAILIKLSPYLPGMGISRESLQSDYRTWRLGLGDEVRRKTEKRILMDQGAV